MNKEHIGAARLRLLSVSQHLAAVQLSEKAEPVVQPLHDAVLQLSQVCRALLDDAEDREYGDATKSSPVGHHNVVTWLDTQAVGAVVNDQDGDPWRKARNGRWVPGQDGEYGGGDRAADDIVYWGPFTLVDAVPVPEIKVGDELTTAEQLMACPRGTVVLTYAGDAWQQLRKSMWIAAGDECEWDAVELISGMHSVTVIHLPK